VNRNMMFWKINPTQDNLADDECHQVMPHICAISLDTVQVLRICLHHTVWEGRGPLRGLFSCRWVGGSICTVLPLNAIPPRLFCHFNYSTTKTCLLR
jgi:hypothetical protein